MQAISRSYSATFQPTPEKTDNHQSLREATHSITKSIRFDNDKTSFFNLLKDCLCTLHSKGESAQLQDGTSWLTSMTEKRLNEVLASWRQEVQPLIKIKDMSASLGDRQPVDVSLIDRVTRGIINTPLAYGIVIEPTDSDRHYDEESNGDLSGRSPVCNDASSTGTLTLDDSNFIHDTYSDTDTVVYGSLSTRTVVDLSDGADMATSHDKADGADMATSDDETDGERFELIDPPQEGPRLVPGENDFLIVHR